VGGVDLVLSLVWGIYVPLDLTGHWAQGPTETETPVPGKVSGVKPDLESLLYQLVHVSCFI
jgi:hypothetical protein